MFICSCRLATIRLFICVVALLMGGLFSSPMALAQLPSGFLQSKTQTGYTAPMGVIFTADGQRQFVWEKSGKIWVSNWNGSQYVKQTTPVLDISEEVGNWRDFGLLSVCLDPNFGTNGKIYLFYVVDRHHLLNFGTTNYSVTTDTYYQATISRVSSYQLLTNNGTLAASVSSRKVLLGETKSTGVPLTHESHAGGTLLFGRDGTLLLTTGDNASYSSTDKGSAPETYFQQAINDGIMRANENVGAFRSQMVNSFCGKVLRMDPNTGDGLPSNPFYDGTSPRSAKSRVWALGLRNPYRMTIWPNTGSTNPADGNPGTLLVGDVGWNVWEDMHVIRQGGENAGWPIFEGLETHSSYATAAQTLENRDEPNPTNTCNKPYLTFADLLKQPTNPVQAVNNPCSGQALPGLQRRYIHARPALDWQHGADVARTPMFNGSVATTSTLGTASGVPGTPFRGNCSTGGAYYAGTAFPANWRNTYYFADYGANWIRAATLDANGAVTQVREFLPNGGGNGIVDLEYNALDGALYYVNINTGELLKISYGGNQPPVAAITASALTGPSPLTVAFRGDASSDPDGDPLTYAWDFGDGTTSTLASPTKVFTSTSSQGFTVRLTVSDGRGLSDAKTVQVSVNNPAPTAKITNPVNNALYPLDRESQYTLTATVTDDDVPSLTYAWQVTLRHNNHEHREPVLTTASPTVNVSPVGCDGETYYYLIQLTVTDRGGLTARDSVKIYPDCNSPSLAISNLQATTLTNAVRLNWTPPSVAYDNVLVVAKAGSGFTTRPVDLVYAQDASFTGTGAAFEGGKVVYQGVATSLVVTNLTAGQKYFFRVYTRRGTAWTGGVETSATPATPVSVSLTPVANACYRLVARVSGKVLGVENGSLADGATVRQRTDANAAWQQWKFVATSNGYYQVVANHSGKVLDVAGSSTADYAAIQQWTYGGGNNQQWKLQYDAQGYYQLVARHSGKRLDVRGSNVDEGGEIIQFTANGTQAQQWSIEQRTCINTNTQLNFSSAGCYRISARNGGKAVSVSNESKDDGAIIRQQAYSGRASQQWKILLNPEGYYRLQNVNSGKSIDVSGGSTADYTNLIQWTNNTGYSQQWRITRDTQGYYLLTARHSGSAMDQRGASSAQNVEIVQYTVNGTIAQQWVVQTVKCAVAGARMAGDGLVIPVFDSFAEPTDEGFKLYPNPAQNSVSIDLRAANGQPTNLRLTDLTGRILYQKTVLTEIETQYTLSTTTYSDGVYLISVNPADGRKASLRLVISR
ncbi:PKD domain-containing protein [Rudanella paleaurantiibacter]|uniref:PKD domain-containing protein n=1 Tax=Rudanella paleaurantiibacter TaxID=2614655 RepID=A0A7J5U232_9BACT|nr:RICIN domain-containing protein [Rudanella paleaurantiibacter]KAB7731741.1 PKD domain-containing protein [Rudanella paleaurantiibacter]